MAPYSWTNSCTVKVTPPDFIFTELMHDDFYNLTDLGVNNANLHVSDLISGCDLNKGFHDDTCGNKVKVTSDTIFKQFKSVNAGFITGKYYTDPTLFKQMFGYDWGFLRQKILTHTTNQGRGEVWVINSELKGTEIERSSAKQFLNLYCFSDQTKHDRGAKGHKKYTPGSKPVNYSESNFNRVFENVPVVIDKSGNKTKNLFFVSDCCSDLIRILSDTPYPLGKMSPTTPPQLNMHILLSTHTLGDPQPKNDHTTKNFIWPLMSKKSPYATHSGQTNASKKIIRYTEYATGLNHIQACNPQLIINASIEMKLDGKDKNLVNQKWKPGANVKSVVIPFLAADVTDSNKKHRKKALQSTHIGKKYGTGVKEYITHAQKKRVGDHGQIAFTKRFPYEIKNHIGDFSTLYTDLPNNKQNSSSTQLDNYTNNLVTTNLTEKQIRQGTYFLTGDWPAFCYAVYNKVNCIIHLRNLKPAGRSEIFVADFNN